jgi:alpha-2-macroglobulin-like protein
MAGGDATVLVKTVVTDSGGQKNEVATNLLVSASPVKVFLFPESGSIVPGVENRFYLVLSDPSGAPLAGDCSVKFRSSTGAESTVKARVDASGLGILPFTPEGKVNWNKAFVEVKPDTGMVSRSEVNLASIMGDARILVRPSRSMARVGDSISLDVLAYGAVSDAYVDITRSNQTVWVGTVTMENGRGQVSIDLDETMKGTLAVSGYLLSGRGEFVRDSRAVYVDSSSDLAVTAVMDKPQYKPAETAKIDFTVTKSDGQPAPSSLGIHIVDEAVFALSEARPGLLKLYFALEEELLKPTYQIGRMFGQTLGNLILHASTASPEDRRSLEATADATIAAQGDVAVSKQFVSSMSGLEGKVASRLQKFSAWLSKRLRRKLENMRKCGSRGWYEFDRAQVRYVQRKFNLDPWGAKYQVNAEEGSSWVQVYSHGPDGKPNTFDDFRVEMDSSMICPDQRPRPRRFAVKMGMADMAAEGMAFGGGARGAGMGGGIGAAPGAKGAGKKGKAVRVRQWFPETLLVENNLVTDSEGKASISVPLADSITSWRMTTVGSDLLGNIGGMTAGIKVFQDFFVDIDFPVFMTQNDQVTFPIVVYSYLDQPQQVEIEVKDGDWFELQGPSKLTLKLKAGEVTSVSIPVKVTKVGLHALTVYGRGSSGFADAVKRTVTVRPDGEEQTAVAGGKLRSGKGKGVQPQIVPVKFPKNTIAGSKQLVVQIMGGLTSHVVQGMDSMLKLPGG